MKRTILLLMLFVSIISCLSLGRYAFEVRTPEGHYYTIQKAKRAFNYAQGVAKYHVEIAWDEITELGMRGADWDIEEFERIVDSGMELVKQAVYRAYDINPDKKYFIFDYVNSKKQTDLINSSIDEIEYAAERLKTNMDKYIGAVRLKFSLQNRNIKKY